MNLKSNKVSLITGGTRGLGKALATCFASMSYDLVLLARDAERLQLVKEDLESRFEIKVTTLSGDLADRDQCQRLSDEIKKYKNKIDVLVNNAGVFLPGRVLDEKEGTLETLISTNLYSAYYLTKNLMPLVEKSMEGMIVNISSVAGLQAYDNGGSYSISKFALRGFSENLRKELQESHVRVTTVYPGAFYSDSWKDSDANPELMMTAEDVALSIANLVKVSPKTVVEELVLRPQKGDI